MWLGNACGFGRRCVRGREVTFPEDHSHVAEYFNDLYFDESGDCDQFNFHLTAYDFTNSPDVVGQMAWHEALLLH